MPTNLNEPGIYSVGFSHTGGKLIKLTLPYVVLVALDGRQYRVSLNGNALQVTTPSADGLLVAPQGANLVHIFQANLECEPPAFVEGVGLIEGRRPVSR